MFNRKKSDPDLSATIPVIPRPPEVAPGAARFTPDDSGRLVAALDCPTSTAHRSYGPLHRDLLHLLTGWETGPDGDRCPVVLTDRGVTRTIPPHEPHRLVNRGETFDLAEWQEGTRYDLRSAERAAAKAAHRRTLADRLAAELLISPRNLGQLSDSGSEVLADLTAEGVARHVVVSVWKPPTQGAPAVVDEVWTVATPVTVELARWPYLDLTGPATFVPSRGSRRVLLFEAPTSEVAGYGPAPRWSGSSLVIGELRADNLPEPLAVYAHGGRAEVVAGVWADAAGLDAPRWFDEQQEEAEQRQQALAVQRLIPELLARLQADYGVTPRTDTERAALKALAAAGWCAELEDSYVLAVPVPATGR